MLEETEPTTSFDDDMLYVDYPDNIQVILDRAIDGKIQVRVWIIGDSGPFAVLNCDLPEGK